jgi:copper chaperone CopZ
MKYLSVLSLILFLAVSCQNNESKKAETTDTETTEVEAVSEFVMYSVAIEGMTCTGCEETIEAGVTKVEGVGSVEANHIDGNASIKFEKGKVDTAAVKEVIEASGYKVLSFKEGSEDTIIE